MLRVTLDTNTVDADKRQAINDAAVGLEVDIRLTTVTERELQGADFEAPAAEGIRETMVWDESPWGVGVWGPSPIVETLVLGESRLGRAALGDDLGATRFERILDVVSDRAFPKPGRRDKLSAGQRRQLRDAMILDAHAREKRDVLVTDDVRGFIGKDGEKRRALEELCRTRIMTVPEFCSFLADRP